MNLFPELLEQIRPFWHKTFGTDLTISNNPDPAANSCRAEICHEGVAYGWLETAVTAEQRPLVAKIMPTIASLMARSAHENNVALGSVQELIVAWDALDLLHQANSLMRSITDPWELTLATLSLLTNYVEAENSFVAQIIDGILHYRWLNNDTADHQAITEQLIELLSASDSMVVYHKDLDTRRLTTPIIAKNFMGQMLPVSNAPATYIGLLNRSNRDFNAGDRRLFESVSEQITTAFDLHALHQEHIQNEQMSRELELAATIQNSFLPLTLPQLPGYELATTLQSAAAIGGDFYDIVAEPHGSTHIVICDVAGKGIVAALLAAHIRAVIRSTLGGSSVDPGLSLQQANKILFPEMRETERFATTFLLSLPDSQDAPPRYASAGHTSALWVHSHSLEVTRLASLGLPLGIFPEMTAESLPIKMEPGDVLLLYSDGLTEVEDEDGRLWGMSGVTDLLVAVHTAPANFIQQSLLTGLKRHRGKLPPADDLTLVVLKKPPVQPQPIRYQHYFQFYGRIDQLPLAEKTIMRLQSSLPNDPETESWLLKVQLAFVEAVSNIFIHAYERNPGQIQGLLTLHDTHLVINMVDVGQPFPTLPTQFKPVDISNPPEHGYGLPIINQVMDHIDYQRLGHDANYWRFTVRLPLKESS